MMCAAVMIGALLLGIMCVMPNQLLMPLLLPSFKHTSSTEAKLSNDRDRSIFRMFSNDDLSMGDPKKIKKNIFGTAFTLDTDSITAFHLEVYLHNATGRILQTHDDSIVATATNDDNKTNISTGNDDAGGVVATTASIGDVAINNKDLIVLVTFREIYKVLFFIAIVWIFGKVSTTYLGVPSLVGEIVAGCVFGPPLADIVPYPGALVLAGNIGLIGLLLESGLTLDVHQLKEVGPRALVMAIIGTILPLLCGIGIGVLKGSGSGAVSLQTSIAIGAAFAPSSLGVASNALSAGDTLNTPVGQLIMASSVFDDVFGLILLSILEVFATSSATTAETTAVSTASPSIFKYIRPFIVSFGYLIVLGGLGITVFPKVIESKILGMFSTTNPDADDTTKRRDQVAMMLLLTVTICYMLALNYSGASYLTGVFLAGLTFSQLHGVHATFVRHAKPILDWLLLLFFSATIGFQVPVTRFGDPYVLKWGCVMLLAVFAKLPIGLLAPRFKTNKSDDFPYNPYIRNVFVTSLAMTCRGEFNVIVASYALSEGLFNPAIYSAVIFAILVGSIVAPLLLSKVLAYYNNLTNEYIDGLHPIKPIGNSCDGYRPLFLAIQARTPVRWNLQETIKKKLEANSLIIIDHRSWHTTGDQDSGQEAVDVTEIFVQDTTTKVRLIDCFGSKHATPSMRADAACKLDGATTSEDSKVCDDQAVLPSRSTAPTFCLEGQKEEENVALRCLEIEQAIKECLNSDNPEDFVIQVLQWQAFIVDRSTTTPNNTSSSTEEAANRKRYYSFHSHVMDSEPQGNADISVGSDNARTPADGVETANATTAMRNSSLFRRVSSNISDPHRLDSGCNLVHDDLWETDDVCHTACRDGYTLTPADSHGVPSIAEGMSSHVVLPSSPHSRQAYDSLDAKDVVRQCNDDAEHVDEIRDAETSVIRDRLSGYVRHHKPTCHLRS